jgi:hypothetical protein
MKEIYFERPQQPICKQDEIQWQEPRQLEDEMGAIRFCWPLASEAQMWEQARCRECNQPAHWVAIGSPFNDGEQYFMGCDSWCYWCFPRAILRRRNCGLYATQNGLVSRPQMKSSNSIRDANLFTDDNTVESALSNVADEISERMETRGGETRETC